jgi:hypothetical protein
MMDDARVQFLPFQAINAYMRPDYRIEVVKAVLSDSGTISERKQALLSRYVKQHVVIPGFRHSMQAPLPVKLKPFIAAFEKQPELAAMTVDIWADLHKNLQDKVFGFLKERGWELLPVDADRTKLPGFLTTWPKDEDFDVIYKAFTEKFPGEEHRQDDVILMAVWLSGRLPYESERKENIYE